MGMKGMDADLATAIRTVIILALAWGIVFVKGSTTGIATLSRQNWIFLVLSGLATGGSWIFYFKAMQSGNVSQVAPIDKSSLALTLILSALILGETITLKVAIGTLLILAASCAPGAPEGGMGQYGTPEVDFYQIKADVFNEQVNNAQAALKSALANQATAKIEVEKIKPLVEGNVVSKMQLESAQAAYDAASAASGMATYLEIITAQNNALQNDLEAINIRRDKLFALTDLYRALGGGTE
ncbi:putative membrane protein [Ostertagia ostertagi]